MLTGASPPWVLSAFVVSYVYARLNKGKNFSLTDSRYCCYSFTLLSIALCIQSLVSIRSFIGDILVPTAMLGAQVTTDVVYNQVVIEGDMFHFYDWLEEADLREYPLLRVWALMSPLWLVATLVVVVYHTRLHVEAMQRARGPPGSKASVIFRRHERTIRVLLLPALYGLMSFQSVIFTLAIVRDGGDGGHFEAYAQRKEYFTEMYTAAFYVGDIYESYALLVFGQIVIDVLREKAQRSLPAPQGEAMATWRLEDPEEEVDSRELLQDGPDSSATHRCKPPSVLMRLLLKSVKWLSCFGIKLFCWTCGLQAVYQLMISTLGYYKLVEPLFSLGDKAGFHMGALRTPTVMAKVQNIFMGAGFVASFAAIGNIMLVEQAFKHHLHEFSPFLKFWGTKILVSIAYMQSMGLEVCPPWSDWSEIRRNLFYSATLSFECFLVSLCHFKAWSHAQTWYGEEPPDGFGPGCGYDSSASESSRGELSPCSSAGPRRLTGEGGCRGEEAEDEEDEEDGSPGDREAPREPPRPSPGLARPSPWSSNPSSQVSV